jgi:hypothetical protein
LQKHLVGLHVVWDGRIKEVEHFKLESLHIRKWQMFAGNSLA